MEFRLKFFIWFTGIFTISIITNAQKIFPGAVGYGTELRGAYEADVDPKILIVDTLYAGNLKTGENRGSFEWALKEDYPRIIIFEVGGVIDYSKTDTRKFYVRDPYFNVYGQTAPSPGITIKSSNVILKPEVHDVLFQHIAFRYGGYLKSDGTVSPTDCMTMVSGTKNIVIDHCSFSWSVDEAIGSYAKNLTISNCLLYEGLEFNYHADETGEHNPEGHGFGPLIASKSRFTSYNNLYAWFTNRFPKLASDDIIYINNYATGPWNHGPDIAYVSSGNDAAFIGNNWYPTPKKANDEKAEYFMSWRKTINLNSKIYLADNNCIRKDKGYDESDNIHTSMSTEDFNKIFTDNKDENVLDISEYTIRDADSVLAYITTNSGTRPWDRDYYDSISLIKLIENKQDFISSPEALPARAYNMSKITGLKTTAGNMENGYDFSEKNVSFSVNGKKISLTKNTSSQKEVLDIINEQLPDGIVAIDHPHILCQHIIIQTTKTGASQSVTIEGDASVFGIANGTYNGEDAPYGYYEYPKAKRKLDIPTEPHEDDNQNGYTNIEEWITSFESAPNQQFYTEPEIDSTIKININASSDLTGWNELYSTVNVLDNLRYSNGETSTIKFEMWENWKSSNGGETSGSCFSEDVIKTYVYTDDDSIRNFIFSGMPDNKIYDIKFLCSRSSKASDERGAEFFYGTENKSINAKGNTCELVRFENIKAIENKISIGYRKRINDFNGHVNAIIITEKDIISEQHPPVINLKIKSFE